MRNDKVKMTALALASAIGGAVAGAGILHAQASPADPPPTSSASASAPAAHTAGPIVPGTLQVTRLSDTTFVVVKDEGDAEVVTLFSTENGLINKKHTGRFLY